MNAEALPDDELFSRLERTSRVVGAVVELIGDRALQDVAEGLDACDYLLPLCSHLEQLNSQCQADAHQLWCRYQMLQRASGHTLTSGATHEQS